MLHDELENMLSAKPIPLTIGDKNLVGLEVQDYELVAERVRWLERLLVLLKVLIPDLENRIAEINTESLREKLNQRISEKQVTDRRLKRDPSHGVVAQAKKNMKVGEYIKLGDFCKRVTVEEICAARKQAGMTQRELAQKAGLSQPQLSRVEKNPTSASTSTLRKIASVLGIKLIV
jgi:ribosome-binding protein aMBF1 (putative translation factor)